MIKNSNGQVVRGRVWSFFSKSLQSKYFGQHTEPSCHVSTVKKLACDSQVFFFEIVPKYSSGLTIEVINKNCCQVMGSFFSNQPIKTTRR